MPTSSLQLFRNQPFQNHCRLSPDTFSMVRKKSSGVGCLNAQRSIYVLKARSKRSGPSTCSRNKTRPALGLEYSFRPFRFSLKLSAWLIIGSLPIRVSGFAALCISVGFLGAFSPLLNSPVDNVLINVLKPSSIQPCSRSFEPTIIGNQV